MGRLLAVAALVAASLSFGAFGGATADSLPGGTEGCGASSPGANSPTGFAYANSCSYRATRVGGFVGGAESWTVTVYNNSSPNKVVVRRYSGTDRACNTASTSPGNFVVVTVTNGTVIAGNPFLAAADPMPYAGGNRCR